MAIRTIHRAALLILSAALLALPPLDREAASPREAWRQAAALPVSKEIESGQLTLYAQSAVLMDGDSGRILYEKEGDLCRPMASTTKIMTCILALELGEEGDWVTASARAAAQPKVRLGVREGEQYRLGDLLYALMLESYNDAAVMLAEHIGGSQEEFARLMNEKAQRLGCRQTYFITPNGLDAVERDESGAERAHETTAKELARIMRYCVKESERREAFLRITQTQNYSFEEKEGRRSFHCVNHNALLQRMEGTLSGKTGFTGGAGYSYVGALESQGRTFIIALLGCGWPPHKTWKWADARTLYEYGKEHYQRKQVYRAEALPPVWVEGGICWGGKGDRIPVLERLNQENVQLPVLLAPGEEVERRLELPDRLEAPVQAGEPIGRVRYLLKDQVLAEYPLYAGEGVERLTLQKAAERMAQVFLGQGSRLGLEEKVKSFLQKKRIL